MSPGPHPVTGQPVRQAERYYLARVHASNALVRHPNRQHPGMALRIIIPFVDVLHRVLFTREVQAWFIIDQLSLYRLVGSPETMAGQMRRLAEIAAMADVTVQVLPAVAHPANASGFVVTSDAALCEHVKGAYVYTDERYGLAKVNLLRRQRRGVRRDSQRQR
jgi:hypothetical protein